LVDFSRFWLILVDLLADFSGFSLRIAFDFGQDKNLADFRL